MSDLAAVETILGQTRVEPRPYQARTVRKTLGMFLGKHRNGAGEVKPAARSVMIESPTGSGKTVIGLLVARALRELAGVRVGWVAMRRNLLQQAEVRSLSSGRMPSAASTFRTRADPEPPSPHDESPVEAERGRRGFTTGDDVIACRRDALSRGPDRHSKISRVRYNRPGKESTAVT
jgi:hypothetical protein